LIVCLIDPEVSGVLDLQKKPGYIRTCRTGDRSQEILPADRVRGSGSQKCLKSVEPIRRGALEYQAERSDSVDRGGVEPGQDAKAGIFYRPLFYPGNFCGMMGAFFGLFRVFRIQIEKCVTVM